MKTDYYVYEWYNFETKEVFYVGKGRKHRFKCVSAKKRSKEFINYYNSHKCDVRKIKTNLTEKEAYELEIKIIQYYLENTSYPLTNKTKGGDGGKGELITNEFRTKMSKIVRGENNPNYGHYWTEEQREKLREKMIDRYNGENNPNYGNRWNTQQRERMSIQRKNNPKYSNGNHGRAKRVIVLETGEKFDCVKLAKAKRDELNKSSLEYNIVELTEENEKYLDDEINRIKEIKKILKLKTKMFFFIRDDNKIIYSLKSLMEETGFGKKKIKSMIEKEGSVKTNKHIYYKI